MAVTASSMALDFLSTICVNERVQRYIYTQACFIDHLMSKTDRITNQVLEYVKNVTRNSVVEYQLTIQSQREEIRRLRTQLADFQHKTSTEILETPTTGTDL